MKLIKMLILVFTLFSLWATTAGAAVYVNQFWYAYTPVPAQPPYGYYYYEPVTIATNTTWTQANGPYILQRSVTVAAGATLTIEAGTVVQVDDNYSIYINGTLSATDVTFTRNGTNYWNGIYFAPTAGLSTLTNCDINYAGATNSGYGIGVQAHGYWEKTALYIDSSNPQITNSRIKNSETHGISLYASGATLTGNTFENMGDGWYPISIDTSNSYPTMSGNVTSGTGFNGVGLASGDITSSGTWHRPGSNFPYLTRGWITIPVGVVLTIDPGVTVKAAAADVFHVNGNLTAPGTEALPITFNSRSATPAAGDWRGIYLAATATASSLTYVTINYAGGIFGGFGLYKQDFYAAWIKAALYLDGVSTPLTNVSILNSATNGLEMYGATPTITSSIFSTSGWSGMKASGESRPVINSTLFNTNGAGGYYAVSLDASSVPNPTNVTFSGNSLQGIQIRGGALTASALWKNWSGNAPYAVTGDMTINAGVTLTVEPTTSVKFWKTGLYVYGNLNANSTNGRITLTSLADDTIGGDTNGDASALPSSSPVPGDWKGIYLSPASGQSLLASCDINYAGFSNSGFGLHVYAHSYWEKTAIYIDSSAPTITNCQIKNSETDGISLYASNATLTNNTFENMGGYPVSFDTSNSFPITSGNATSGTGFNGIGLASGDITSSGTWNRPGVSFPYLTRGWITIPVGVVLTIDPGVTVKANGADVIHVNGNLTAVGTAPLPITFSSRSATPAAGDWRGIYLAPTATASSFSYVTINYAGGNFSGYGLYMNVHGDWVKAALYLDGVNPPLTNVSILNSQNNGLEMYAATPTITNGVFSACGWSGLKASGESRPIVNTATFSANGAAGYYAVSLDASSVPNPTNVTFSGNSYQGVQIRGGTLPVSALWKNWSGNAPYAVTGDMTINAGVTLTVEPTTSVKFWKTGLYVYGNLNANSTNGRITLTSLADDAIGGDTNGDALVEPASSPIPGDWKGIYLSPASGQSLLANCDVNYSGFINSGYGLGVNAHSYWEKTAIYIDSSSPTISNCQIKNSETNGIELYSSKATLTSNTFTNMGSYPITFDTLDTFPVMSGNATSGTGYNGIGLPFGNLTVTGNWNLPGSSFPYLMTRELTVDAGVNLTIAAGNTIKSNGSGFYVNGTLDAVGTAALPISFTRRYVESEGQVPVRWLGIYLSPTAGSSTLTYVTIQYAGATNSGYGLGVQPHGSWVKASLYVDGISPPLTSLSILNSETNGVELYGSSSAVTNSLFSGCGWTQLAATGSSTPTISTSRFIGDSSVWGITNDTPANVINARNNYWGASTGPTHSSNPGGTGVKVSNGVDFINYRTSESFFLAVTIAGSGTVYSTPTGITACSSGTCTAPFNYLQQVVLSTAPAWYTAVVWSGCSAAGNDCSVVMDTDRSVTATFGDSPNVKLTLKPLVPYGTIQSAYNATSTPILVNDKMQTRDITFFEDLIFSQAVAVILEGGMNSGFTLSTGYTVVKGIMKVRNGKVIVNKVKVR
ncbi:MAG: beta strand repeat-containing protein [Desulfuromonadaceae bacterium]